MSEQQGTFDITNTGTPTIVTELVGEGRKFKTVEDLAKGKLEADDFIEKLKTENKALREALSEESNPEEMLRKINETLSNNGSVKNTTTQTSNQPQKESLSKQEVLELLSAREQQERIKQNTQMFNEQVNKAFGEKATDFVTNRLNDLGMDRETLNDLATRNPKAALRVLGLKDNASGPVSGTMDSSINTEAFFGPAGQGNGETQNFAYFQKLRRELKEGYYTPEIQKRVFEARKKLGDAFWK